MVLSHDKPGCGGSPGDWRTQDFAERAEESLAALELLRAQPGVDPERVGLLGISQGGWICQQAAAVGGTAVAFIVTISGRGNPRCSRSATASARLSTTRSRPWPGSTSGPVADDAPERILADQLAYADRPWFTTATEFAYETTDLLTFAIRAGFDPVEVLPQVRCPVFAAFGGGDPTVPVQSSLEAYARHLPHDPRHALVVHPRADHNLFVEERDSPVPLARQLAPGFFPMLADRLGTV